MSMCKSADEVLQKFAAGKAWETSFNRVEAQKIKCGFGQLGVCCRLCANGPCRITPQAPRGVCGATSDTIVARNFLRAVASGAACYLHILENTARNLKHTGEKKQTIRSESTLNQLADLFGVGGDTSHQKAILVANKVLNDLYRPRHQKMELVEKLASTRRFQKWQELNILPGGAKSEVFDAIVKSSTNLSSDPQDMLFHSLSLGIATGLYGLMLTNLLNDVMLGEPVIRQARVGFKVVDPNYINIMITGHQHSVIADLQEKLVGKDAAALATSVGAKGFKLVGCTCVGQDLQLRGEHYQEVFSGHAGNNFTSESLVTTGAIDLIVSEFNCTLPGLEPVAQKLKVDMICLDDVAKKAGADYVPFSKENEAEISQRIMQKAKASYQRRRGSVSIDIPNHGHDDVLTGLSEKSLKNFLGNSWKPLIELIADGRIKGIAAIVGCSNLTAQGHDVFTVELTRELIKKDILVLSAGCSSGGLENVGLMSPKAAALAGDSLRAVCESLKIPPVLNFGPCLAIGRLEMVAAELAQALQIDIPQLPLVLSAPQWLEEQALADGAFGLALGLPLHLAISPFIGGSRLVSDVLMQQLPKITGGQLVVNGQVHETAEILESIILNRRQALGLSVEKAPAAA